MAFLVVLVWWPLGFGGNRTWSWAIACIGTLAVGMIWLVGYGLGRRQLSSGFRQSSVMVCLWAGWVLYGALQWLPLPVGLVEFLSPGSATLALEGGAKGWVTLSLSPYESKMATAHSLTLMVVFCLVLLLTKSRRRLKWMVGLFIMIGTLQALYGAFMAMSGLEYGFFAVKEHMHGLPTGTFVNRNHFAGFLVLCLCLGVGVLVGKLGTPSAVDGRSRIRDTVRWLLSDKMRLRLYLVIMVIALVLTRSRMGNASFFIALLSVGAVGLWWFRSRSRPVLILLLSLVVIDVVIIGTWFGVEQVVDRVQQTASVNMDSGEMQDKERLDTDTESLALWREVPLFGTGGGTFATVFPAWRRADMGAFYDHAHNDYVEFLVEYGVIGVTLLASMLVLTLVQCVRRIYDARSNYVAGICFGVTMGVVAALLHASVDFNLHIPGYSAYFVVLMALPWVRIRTDSRD